MAAVMPALPEHELIGGYLVCMTPEYRAWQRERENTSLRESMSGYVVLCRPSEHLPPVGDPALDRAEVIRRMEAWRMAKHGDPFTGPLCQPAEVVGLEVDARELPGHGARYAKLAAELGFTVRAIYGEGYKFGDAVRSHSLRCYWPHGASGRFPIVAALWVNGTAQGAGVATERSRSKFGVSVVPETLRAIAAGA